VKCPTMRIGIVASAALGAAYRLSEEFAGLDTVQEARKPGRRGLDPVEEPPMTWRVAGRSTRAKIRTITSVSDIQPANLPAGVPVPGPALVIRLAIRMTNNTDTTATATMGYRPPPASRLLRDDQFSPTAWA
jgi:hypothetical protein